MLDVDVNVSASDQILVLRLLSRQSWGFATHGIRERCGQLSGASASTRARRSRTAVGRHGDREVGSASSGERVTAIERRSCLTHIGHCTRRSTEAVTSRIGAQAACPGAQPHCRRRQGVQSPRRGPGATAVRVPFRRAGSVMAARSPRKCRWPHSAALPQRHGRPGHDEPSDQGRRNPLESTAADIPD